MIYMDNGLFARCKSALCVLPIMNCKHLARGSNLRTRFHPFSSRPLHYPHGFHEYWPLADFHIRKLYGCWAIGKRNGIYLSGNASTTTRTNPTSRYNYGGFTAAQQTCTRLKLHMKLVCSRCFTGRLTAEIVWCNEYLVGVRIVERTATPRLVPTSLFALYGVSCVCLAVTGPQDSRLSTSFVQLNVRKR